MATVLSSPNSVPPVTVAVTVMVSAAPLSSATVVGFTDRVTPVGAASSSVMVTLVLVTVTPARMPETVSASPAPSSTVSWVGASEKLALPEAASFAMVTSKAATAP